MAIIGIDKGMRSQEGGAARSRERREAIRAGRTPGTYDAFDDTEDSCGICGAPTARGDLFLTEGGSACPSCYSADASQNALVVAGRAPARLAMAAAPVPAAAIAGAMAFTAATATPAAFLGKGGMGWLLIASLGVICALVAGLHGLKAATRDLNPIALSDDEEPAVSWGAVTVDAWAVVVALLAGLATPIIAVLPLL